VRRLGLACAVLFLLCAGNASAAVLVVGDSLVIGTTPYLKGELSEPVTGDGRIGRPSSEAVSVLRSRFSGQRVVVFDAGVNDDPSQPSRLSNDLAAARSITGDRCLVVSTMHRPPYRGVSVDGLNRAVRSFASSSPAVRLVDWRAAAVANPRLINPDGVHPTSAGYQFRARLFAQAIAECGSGGGSGGGAPPDSGGLPPAGTPAPRDLRPTPPRPRKRRGPAPREPKPEAPKPELGSEVLLTVPLSVRGLRGELIAPGAKGRHPAVAMLHGSGNPTREVLREQAEFLAQHGVAALIWDKRRDASYSQLAGDARAAVALLRSRTEVRPDGIGLWGFSEGGSIAATVAAGNPQVRAVALVSPLTIPRAAQEDWAVRHSLDGAGGAPVSRYYSLAADVDSDLGFDPAPAWRRVSQPVFAAWGADDDVVPAHDSAAALASALADGTNRDRVFRTYPAATHVLGVEAEGNRPGSAPGFKEFSAEWLRDHLAGRPAPLISTPLPPASDVRAEPVASVSVLERWPVQLAWLVLPALALVLLALRLRRRRGDEPSVRWWWLAGVAALDLLAVAALAFAVAALVEDGGEGVEMVAGLPVVLLVAWLLTLAGVTATALLVGRIRRARAPGMGVALAGSAWLLLALYWLV
jgi:dienelactone hydrolase